MESEVGPILRAHLLKIARKRAPTRRIGPCRRRGRFARAGSRRGGDGATHYSITLRSFGCGLYPFVIFKLGLVAGGVVMAALSFLDCLLLLRLYDWLKRDWLGIEWLKEVRGYTGTGRWRRGLAWTLNRGDGVAFVALSLRFDPFITTAYLRRGAYGGLSARDWRIFLGSVLLSNAAWALVCFGGVEAVRRLWL